MAECLDGRTGSAAVQGSHHAGLLVALLPGLGPLTVAVGPTSARSIAVPPWPAMLISLKLAAATRAASLVDVLPEEFHCSRTVFRVLPCRRYEGADETSERELCIRVLVRKLLS